MTQGMERCSLDLGTLAGRHHRRLLIVCAPLAAKYNLRLLPLRSKVAEKLLPFLSQNDVAVLVNLAFANMQRAAIGVEISHAQPRKLLIASAGFQCGSDQDTKLRIACINEPFRFGKREVARASDVAHPKNSSAQP